MNSLDVARVRDLTNRIGVAEALDGRLIDRIRHRGRDDDAYVGP